MKYKVKYRVTREDGKKQKYAINMEEGASFAIANETLGAELRRSSEASVFCTLTIRGAVLFVSDSGFPGGIKLNGKPGSEFEAQPGDFVQVGDYSIEFLEIPHAAKTAAATQFLDISEMVPDAAAVRVGGAASSLARGGEGGGRKNGGKAARRAQYLEKEKQKLAEARAKVTTGSTDRPLALEDSPVTKKKAEMPFELERSKPAAAASAASTAVDSDGDSQASSGEMTLMGVARPGAVRRERAIDRPAERSAERASEHADTHAGASAETMDAPVQRPVRSERTRVESSRSQSSAEPSLAAHLGVSGATLVVGAGIVGQVISRFQGDSNFMGFVWGACGGLGGALIAAGLLHFGGEFLKMRAQFKDFLRFFGYASIPAIVWSFSFAFPMAVIVVMAVLIGGLILAAFVVKFAPDIQRFVASTAVLGVCCGGVSYAVLHAQKNLATPPQTVAVAPAAPEREPAGAVQPAPAEQPTAPTDGVAVVSPQQNGAQTQPATVLAPAQAAQADQQARTEPQSAGGAPQAAPHRDTSVPDSFALEEYFSAVKSGNLAVVRTLIEKGAVDPDFTLDHGTTALMYAAANGQNTMVRYLLSKRVNINAQDPNGTTALMWAAYRGHGDIVELLVGKGANMAIKREDGDRAVDIARRWKHIDVVKLLNVLQQRQLASQPSQYHKNY